MTVAIISTAILSAMIFVLGANVTRIRAQRGKTGESQAPSDPADTLLKAVRAHGNASEYVPTIAILMLIIGARGAAAWTVALMICATAARLLHAYGMLTTESLAKETLPRVVGATGTYVFGIALAVAALTVA